MLGKNMTATEVRIRMEEHDKHIADISSRTNGVVQKILVKQMSKMALRVLTNQGSVTSFAADLHNAKDIKIETV